MDTAKKHIKNLLEFFEKFKISGFEIVCNIMKQIATGLVIEIKIKEYHFHLSFTWNNY